MVLKKRASAPSKDEAPKKKRKDENTVDPSENKKSQRNKDRVIKEEIASDMEEGDVNAEEEAVLCALDSKEGSALAWPEPEVLELFNRIEENIPPNDTLKFDTRSARLDWDEIAFNDHTPLECQNMWTDISKKIRGYRLLKEILADARQWIHKPWTNFYNSSKQNQHPDMPRRPLNEYMVYYLEKKDKFAAAHPDLDMTRLSTLISHMYKKLPQSKKQKYIDKAAEQRKEYAEKMRLFYEKHPECKEQKERPKDSKSRPALPVGLRKPRTPQQMFIEDRIQKQQSEPNFDKNEAIEAAKQQWKDLSNKKKLVWINWALDEESKYLESLKLFMAENPNFKPPPHKPVLKKEEYVLRDRMAGKPAKPPNSAYSLYSTVMLAKCTDLRALVPKARMQEISKRWKEMPEEDKAEFAKKVKYAQDKYKMEYAAYLESLPDDVRQEELLKNQTRKKKDVQSDEVVNEDKVEKSKPKKPSKKASSKSLEKLYFPGEPRPPPVNAFDFFVESFVSDTKLNAKEAPRFWEMLPSSDKAKFQRKLKELKEKYIKDYRKFLKSLDEDQVAKYNELQKQNKEREKLAEARKAKTSKIEALEDSDDNEASSSEEDDTENKNAGHQDSDTDENEDKKSDSSSDSSSSSSNDSSSSSSSSGDSDSSSDDSDDDDDEKKANTNSTKKEASDSDSESD